MFCVYHFIIKLHSTGACANITIREIMLINIISSASWALQGACSGGHPKCFRIFCVQASKLCCNAQSAAATTWYGWRQGQGTHAPLASSLPLDNALGGACCQTPLFFRVFPLKQFPCLCVHCILGLFAVPELQRSVQQGSGSHSRRQHRHWSLCALQYVFVCSARNAVVSSERVKLTPSSPARALVTVCIAFCVWLQCLKCSGQFSKAQAHTVVPLEGIPRTGSSKDFKSMADIGGEDVGSKVTGWLVGQ